MGTSNNNIKVQEIAPGRDFLRRCAEIVCTEAAAYSPDLSDLVFVIPNQHIAPALRRFIAKSSGRTVMLPKMFTLTGLVQPQLAEIKKDPASARLFRLFDLLSNQSLIGNSNYWHLAKEFADLFDELTAASVVCPNDQAEIATVLEKGYGLKNSGALGFEAAFVHALWKADSEGTPSPAMALQLALDQYAKNMEAGKPFFFMCDGTPTKIEQRFIEKISEKSVVNVFLPDRHAISSDPLLQALSAAWPENHETAPPARDRALELRKQVPASPVAARISIIEAPGLEQEAATATTYVREQISRGAKSIAIIAADRVGARRTQAMLASNGIKVADETGWLLSTTRAAAFIDAILESVVSNGHHRAVLDLIKSPFACADWVEKDKHDAIREIEQSIRATGFLSGIEGLSQLGKLANTEFSPMPACTKRIIDAVEAMSGKPTTVVEWISRLKRAITALGASEALAKDEAGEAVHELLEQRTFELADHQLSMSFGTWRGWLDYELEAAMFRNKAITSPVTITHLAAARLRNFDAAVLIGADKEHLSARHQASIFSSDSVRRELRLPTRADAKERLREDLALLISGSKELLFTKKAIKDGEKNLLSHDLEILDLVSSIAWGGGLVGEARDEPVRGDAGGLQKQKMPKPSISKALTPQAISASGYLALVTCPYKYFIEQALGLVEQTEIAEEMEKADYGRLVHEALFLFHKQFPRISGLKDEDLVAALTQITSKLFQSAISKNFMEYAWSLRWETRIPGYIEWAKKRESEGWVWSSGEKSVNREVALPDGDSIALKGRIDRIDNNGDSIAILDYKAQPAGKIKRKIANKDMDVQLPFYILLNKTEKTGSAAYISLDDKEISEIALDDATEKAEQHLERIVSTFMSIKAGAEMPAHGATEDCNNCRSRGVCRKDYR